MGEAKIGGLRLCFDNKVKLEFHGARVSSDGGLLAYRELDEALGLTAMADECLKDFRPGGNVQHKMAPLLRQSVYGRLAGYEDLNDAERLRVDPVLRRVVGGRATSREARSTSEMGRFETDMLTQPENLNGLMELSGRWIDRANERVCPTGGKRTFRSPHWPEFRLGRGSGGVFRCLKLPEWS
jgi:hypothetical protein